MQFFEVHVIDERSNSGGRARERGEAVKSLNDGDITQLILASSLSATRPLLGLTLFLIREGVLDGVRLKAFLEPLLGVESFPPETRAMLAPIWATFMAQIGVPQLPSRSDGEDANDG
jgi:hypothetical protein